MKVLIISNVISMITQFNRNNIEILQELGCEVHVACNLENTSFSPKSQNRKYINELEDKGIILHQVDFGRRYDAYRTINKCCKQIEDILRKEKVAFVHCHSQIAGLCGRIAAKKCKVKSIYTAHGFMFYKGASWLRWMIFYPQDWVCSFFTDILITINREDYLLAQKRFHSKEIYYIPGVGIDINKIKQSKNNRQELRQRLGVGEDEFMVLSVGELSERKDQKTAIKAISNLNNSKVKYFICGKGDKYEEYVALIRELKMEANIFLLGYRTDIYELCKASDLFVFPSLQEGLPVAPMEAMACKVPIICTNIRGNVDLIDNTDYLFECKEYEELSNKIQKCIDNDNSGFVAHNFELIQKKFSTTVVNNYLKSIYMKLIYESK